MANKKASECASMDDVRSEIDRLDEALVDLIAERFTYVDRAWQLKASPDEAIVPWRIQQVVDKVKGRAAAKGLPPELAESRRAFRISGTKRCCSAKSTTAPQECWNVDSRTSRFGVTTGCRMESAGPSAELIGRSRIEMQSQRSR